MEFGTLIFTKPERAMRDVPYAEARGFTHAWIPDSHMIWGDTYACMALAAVNSKKIKLGTGIAVASNRIPPVTVHSIATINQLAPGRTILGFGTGHTGRRVMGLPPVGQAEFREQVRVIRDLLKTGEADYRAEGRESHVRFLHRDLRFINLDDPIPFYVAANGPRTLALAGEFGDGIITTGVATPERVTAVRKHAEAGAARVGRSAAKLPIVSLTHVCVLKPGEGLDSPRVKAMTGPWVMASLHALAAGYASPRSLPPDARKVFDAYAEQVARMPGTREQRDMLLHTGHCTFVSPEERKFVTAETIRATTIAGPREPVIDQLRALKAAGLSQVFLNPPMEGFEECLDDISRELIGRV
jgi:alkanesulfonate monooxygenase SsuD/methylene tetrahydromethanopterin reductase-like flavin-dependent oxidoreductase (luciferase family)